MIADGIDMNEQAINNDICLFCVGIRMKSLSI